MIMDELPIGRVKMDKNGIFNKLDRDVYNWWRRKNINI